MPTFDELIASSRNDYNVRAAKYNDLTKQINAIRGGDGYAGETDAEKALLSERAPIDDAMKADLSRVEKYEAEAKRQAEIDKAMATIVPVAAPAVEARTETVSVKIGSEAHTYRKDGEHSFFRDMLAHKFGDDIGAEDRLRRNTVEVKTDRARKNGQEVRTLATTGLAGLVPPQYLVDQYALVARAGRPTANVVTKMQIPDQGMTLYVPRGTTGASAAIQASENATVSTTDQVWSNVSVPVATIAGYAPLSRQSIERAAVGMDQLIFADIAAAYAVALDAQVLNGTGSSGQMLGILQTASINQATAFGAAATISTFYSKLAGQINAVETTRYLAPDLIIMHPRRWNWLLSQVDSSNRPYVIPNMNGNFNSVGLASEPIDTPSAAAAGWLFGLPVITDASVPTSVGTGPEDQVIVCRKEDLILFEDGDGSPATLTFEQTSGTSLTVNLVAYGYAAFTAGRFPTAVGVVGGNAGSVGFGLVAPTF